jgi:transcriptional regulator with XRE-family HTH domain
MTEFHRFGTVLHQLRRKYHVTKKELCGALEIDEAYLDLLEKGVEQPSEDLVEQMISHFSLDESLADNLWTLAGHTLEKTDESNAQTVFMPLAELKINYTDMVHISVNNFGVVLNFMQNVGPNNQPIVVSRMGMSKEHAKSISELINKTLLMAETAPTKKARLELPEGEQAS